MSEYQYYEFHTIDRALTAEERAEIDTWSSRSEASATSVSFEYHFGDFRKDPEYVTLQYFDAMMYIANWGTKQVMFRLPKELVDFDRLKLYQFDDGNEYERGIHIKRKGEYVLINIVDYEEDGYGWIEADGLLLNIMPLRNDILEGDYRSLYLLWLYFLSSYELDEEFTEEDEDESLLNSSSPPVPSGFAQFYKPLNALVDFFKINTKLSEFARQESIENGSTPPPTDWSKLLQKLSEKEKDAFLMKAINGDKSIGLSLKKRLMAFTPSTEKGDSSGKQKTFGEIWEQIKNH